MAKQKWLLWLVMLAPSVLLRLYPAIPIAADEKVFAAASKMLAGGAVLYRDVFDHKGPALYWSFNMLQSVVGSYWGVRFGTILAAMAMQVAVYWIVLGLLRGRREAETTRSSRSLVTSLSVLISRPLAFAGPSLAVPVTARRIKAGRAVAQMDESHAVPPSTAETAAFWAALAIGFASWLTNRIFGVELFMVAPLAVGLALIIQGRHVVTGLVAGALFGFAIMVKPTAALDVAMIGAIGILGGRVTLGRAGAVVVATAATIALFLLPFVNAHAMDDLRRVLFGFNAYYSRERPFTPEILVWLAKEALVCAFLWIPSLLMLRHKTGDPDRRVVIALLVWTALAIGASLMARRPFNHYLLQPYLPMAILAGLWLARLRLRTPALLRPPVALGWVAALGLFGFAHATKLRADEITHARTEIRMAGLVDGLTKDGQSVYVWGNDANIYTYSRRPAATRYIFYPPFRGKYGGAAPAFEQAYWREWAQAFDRAKPTLIVDCSQTKWNDLPWLNPYNNPDLAERLDRDYRWETTIGGYRVFIRKIGPIGPIRPIQ